MTCAAVMNPTPLTALDNSFVSDVLDIMTKHHLSVIPVVNTQGKFIGLFGLHRLLGLMMPKAATLSYELDDLDDLDNLGFITESVGQVKTRMTEFISHQISDFLEEDPILIQPEASLDKALMLLYKYGSDLPVVDDTGRLVGVISPWDIISKIKNS